VRLAAAAFVLTGATIPAAAQDIRVTFGSGAGLTERVLQLVALVTILWLAPSILIMMTSFTRIESRLARGSFLFLRGRHPAALPDENPLT
jgi:flagellar biosynthesis protein FliP